MRQAGCRTPTPAFGLASRPRSVHFLKRQHCSSWGKTRLLRKRPRRPTAPANTRPLRVSPWIARCRLSSQRRLGRFGCPVKKVAPGTSRFDVFWRSLGCSAALAFRRLAKTPKPERMIYRGHYLILPVFCARISSRSAVGPSCCTTQASEQTRPSCHPERESEANESRDLPRVGGAFINNDACVGWGDPSTTPLRGSAQDDGRPDKHCPLSRKASFQFQNIRLSHGQIAP